jgi:signal transduction histidine kinase
MTEAVASRLRIEIEHYALSAVLEETVASRERIRLARDLHDGILQSLTAAALQLKTTASHSDEKVRGEIATVRNLLLSEQQRLRTFVDNRQALDTQQGIILYDEMQRQIEELEQQWGCRVVLQAIRPQNATVPLELTRQIRFLLAEAVANAVQHGNASRVNIAFERTPNDVQLLIRDNGQGLRGTNGNYSQTELAILGIGPQSIFKRITELRGTLSLSSSPKGVELCIGLACEGIAGSKTEHGAARAFR